MRAIASHQGKSQCEPLQATRARQFKALQANANRCKPMQAIASQCKPPGRATREPLRALASQCKPPG
eukprot:10289984-Alexandrium_andersonii.AAC.1